MKSASNNLVGLDNYTRPAEQETELNILKKVNGMLSIEGVTNEILKVLESD